MVVTIPDDLRTAAHLTEQEVLVELACRLFGAGRLTLHDAGRLAGLPRAAFEDALRDRHIPVYDVSVEELQDDVARLERSGV